MQVQQNINDDEIIQFDVALLTYFIKQHIKLFLLLVILILGVGFALLFGFCQDKYRSEAKFMPSPYLLTKPEFFPSSNLEQLITENTSSDALKSQIEIIKSRKFNEKVYTRLKQEKLVAPSEKVSDFIDGILTVEEVKGTSLMRIAIDRSRPEEAQKINQIYLEEYQTFLNDTIFYPMKKQRQVLKDLVLRAQNEYNETMDQLEQYETENGTVALDRQLESNISRYAQLKADSEEMEKTLAEKTAELENLQNRLQLDTKSAIHAVAKGQDNLYTDLAKKLQEAEQEYNVKALTFAPTNPDLVKLKEKINILQQQLRTQEQSTLGRTGQPRGISIQDDVRREMVKRLAFLDGEIKAIQGKQIVNQVSLTQMQAELTGIPKKQVIIAKLTMSQKYQETVLGRLREKLTTLRINQSTVDGSIQLVDPPSLPEHPNAPSKLHYTLAIVGLGLLLPAAFVFMLANHLATSSVAESFLEHTLQIPVLAVVPWWSKNRKNYAVEDVTQAYQTMALNVKKRFESQEHKALTVASVFTENPKRSTALVNMALCLAQSGDRVLLIDGDLKNPKLHDTFGEQMHYEAGLAKILSEMLTLEKLAKVNPVEVYKNLLAMPCLSKPSPMHPNIYFLSAGSQLESSFERLSSKHFKQLINILKQHYDWVLLDAPALLASADTYALLSASDGLILIVERNATKRQVELAVKQVQQINHNGIVGAVLRAIMEEDEKPIPMTVMQS